MDLKKSIQQALEPAIAGLAKRYYELIEQNQELKIKLSRKEWECESLKDEIKILEYNLDSRTREIEEEYAVYKDKLKYLHSFLRNRYNYGSFRPMWGAYLLKHLFNEEITDFFDEKDYEMADTIEAKETELARITAQYNEVVKQNKDLQKEVKQLRSEAANAEQKFKRIKFEVTEEMKDLEADTDVYGCMMEIMQIIRK